MAIAFSYLTSHINFHCLSPGRWFGTIELKAMLAHVVLHYDVKFEREGVRPENEWYVSSNMPNQKAEVMFRRRGH